MLNGMEEHWKKSVCLHEIMTPCTLGSTIMLELSSLRAQTMLNRYQIILKTCIGRTLSMKEVSHLSMSQKVRGSKGVMHIFVLCAP